MAVTACRHGAQPESPAALAAPTRHPGLATPRAAGHPPMNTGPG